MLTFADVTYQEGAPYLLGGVYASAADGSAGPRSLSRARA